MTAVAESSTVATTGGVSVVGGAALLSAVKDAGSIVPTRGFSAAIAGVLGSSDGNTVTVTVFPSELTSTPAMAALKPRVGTIEPASFTADRSAAPPTTDTPPVVATVDDSATAVMD